MNIKNSYSQNIQIIKIIEPDSSFFKFKLISKNLETEKYYYGVNERRLFNASYKLLQNDRQKELINSYQQLVIADSLLIGALNSKIKFLDDDNQYKQREVEKLNIIIETKKKTNTKVISIGSIVITVLTGLLIIK